MNNQIRCPYCNKSFEPTDAYKHELEEKLIRDTQGKHQEEIEKLKREKQELSEAKDKEIEVVKKQVAEKAKIEARESVTKELKDREDQIAQLKKRAEEAEEEELKVRKEKRELEESKRKFELEKQRQLDEEREKIRVDAKKEAEDGMLLTLAQEKKRNEDAQKQILELQRKLQQGSQQAQGEVLELDLEERLKTAFIYDEVSPIGKGIEGGDIIQKVRNQAGKVAGTILWETKRAKWSPSWLPKLREDGRKFDATLVVLVSVNLPKETDNFQVTDNVIVTSYKYALPLAGILRRDVMKIASAKFATENKDEKLEFLYQYLQSEAFRSRFEAFAEGVVEMQSDLLTEKRVMERSWKRRETQIIRTINNVSKMYGELQGIMGSALPDIKILQLESGENE